MRDDKHTLEDFALKSLHLAKMTGVDLATHAIQDGFLLMHTGVGCKYKTGVQIAQHDWAKHPNRHEAWTQVGEVSLIKGSAARIGPYARSWYDRRHCGFMVVVSAYFIELTGEDIRDVVAQTAQTMPCPMGVVPTAGPNGGFFEGYTDTMVEVLRSMDWASPPDQPRTAAVVGHFFHRYEPDQQADLAQLRKLVEQVGLTPGPVVFSGVPYAELAEAPRAGVVIQLPYARPARRALRKLLKGRQVVELDLPYGVAGTRRFLRELGEATGADLPRLEAQIERQVEAVRPHLAHLSANFQEVGVAVFADTPQAAGLVSLLRELGLRVPLIGLRDDVLGGSSKLYDTLERNGLALEADAEVLVRPSLRAVRERVTELVHAGRVHAVIGSSIELDCLSHAPDIRAALSRLALIETGFPCKDRHAALAIPDWGFSGALVWAQRILDGVMGPRIGVRSLG